MSKSNRVRRGPWRGSLLVVDLAGGSSQSKTLPEGWGREYLGGPGLAARLLYEAGNEGDCMIAPGFLCGLPVPTAAKGSICAVSPLTGRWGESSLGGFWPRELKLAGWDLVQLKGASRGWTLLRIEDDRVSFEPADEFLGLSPEQTAQAVRERWGKGFWTAAIGEAGENRVGFAGISAARRWAGRCGLGADWGSRRLKGVAVKGSGKVEAHAPEALRAVSRRVREKVTERCQSLHLYGTAGSTVYRENLGALPIKNFMLGNFEGAGKISGQAMVEGYEAERRACAQCPIACAKHIKVRSLGYEGPQPEYEAVAALGSMLLIDDPETVVLANAACNRLGLDVISTGVVAAFAVEAFEKGYLAGRDLGGLEPAWGSREYLLGVIDLIARREGLGDLLADGVRAAAEKLGPGAMEFAVHAHGLEVPMQDPRAFVSLALSYAVSPRGASHTETMSFYVEQGFELADMGYPDGLKLHVAEGKGKMTRIMHDVATAYENGGLCKFMLVAGIGPTAIAEWVSAAAGWEFSREDVLQVGARTVAAKHFFNFDRLGLKPEADLARRMRLEPRGTGGSARSLPDMETLVRDYYAARGWSEDGRPPDQERPR